MAGSKNIVTTKSNTKLFRNFLPLLFVGLLGACGNADTTANDNQILQDSSVNTINKLLVTGVRSTDKESFWYCTYLSGNTFVERVALRFWGDTNGEREGVPLSWRSDLTAIDLEYAGISESWRELSFGQRLFPADNFKATNNDGLAIACDWTGRPRQGELLEDVFGIGNSLEDETGDSVEILLVTGFDTKDLSTYWSCFGAQPLVDGFSFGFLDSGKVVGALNGRWSLSGQEDLLLTLDTGDELWSNFDFFAANQGWYSGFKVTSDIRGDLSCVLEGASRAAVWVPGEV